ncbi:MAG: sulfatase [bacterium]|nr:sulfatase [bacterium]
MRESRRRERDPSIAISTLARCCAACLVGVTALVIACASPPAPSIVVITVDTLRADAIDFAGSATSGSVRTPNIARLAATGTVFERATAPMSLTRPSHFSIFTGRYPREHGVVNNQIALAAGETTVAEVLQGEGFATGAFVGVNLLGQGSGADQGFDVFVAPRTQLEWPGSRVVGEALSWLDGLAPDRPFFLWVHVFDPHQPYDPPGDLRGNLDPKLAARYPVLGWREFLEIARTSDGQISRVVVDHAKALYEAEVASVDRELGLLLERLEGLRDADDLMVVFTADHGECFENGIYFEHSECLLEGGVRVPLIVRHAPQFAGGQRVPALVSNADVAPTILRAAGIEPPASMSVPPLQEDAAQDDRYVLLQNPFYPADVLPARRHRQVVIRRIAGESVVPFVSGEPTLGIVRGAWKYLRRPDVEELYASGPLLGPEQNVALREREARREMRAALDRALERHPPASIAAEEINPELLKSLRALGYVE